jgi:hypothetical protein
VTEQAVKHLLFWSFFRTNQRNDLVAQQLNGTTTGYRNWFFFSRGKTRLYLPYPNPYSGVPRKNALPKTKIQKVYTPCRAHQLVVPLSENNQVLQSL